jgi:hypothetical protein
MANTSKRKQRRQGEQAVDRERTERLARLRRFRDEDVREIELSARALDALRDKGSGRTGGA